MKDRIRPVAVLCLAFAMALFGAASALPHPMTAGGMTIEICADGGANTILVDAEGNPVDAADECIKCLFCLSFDKELMTPEGVALGAPTGWRAVQPLPPHHHLPKPLALWPLPRGPPGRPEAIPLPAAMATERDVAAGGDGRLEFSQVSCPSEMQNDGQTFEDARS